MYNVGLAAVCLVLAVYLSDPHGTFWFQNAGIVSPIPVVTHDTKHGNGSHKNAATPKQHHAADKDSLQHHDIVLQTFVHASCNRQWLPQNMFDEIVKHAPQLFVWTGDAVYLDSRENIFRLGYGYPWPSAEVRSAINFMKHQNEPYRRLLEATPLVIGVFDDHDRGMDDSDHNFDRHEEFVAAFLDLLDEPADSVRRIHGRGLYEAHAFGHGKREVCVILLDIRTHQNRDEDGDLLGEVQWAWLENILQHSTARLHFIVSPLQFVETKRLGWDWGRFPKSQVRMLQLLARVQARGVLFLSGDVHYASIARLRRDACKGRVPAHLYPETLYPIYDFTSSSLTHSFVADGGLFTKYMPAWFRNAVFTFIIGGEDTKIFPDALRTMNNNFGKVNIDWSGKKVVLEAWGHDERLFFRHSISFSELEPLLSTNEGDDTGPSLPPCGRDEEGVIWTFGHRAQWVLRMLLAAVAAIGGHVAIFGVPLWCVYKALRLCCTHIRSRSTTRTKVD